MIRLNIIAEGPTEQLFVNGILTEYLGNFNISVAVNCVLTNKEKKAKGGLANYKKAQNHITSWLKQDRDCNARFTTMFDLYGLPNNFPGFQETSKIIDPYEKINLLESALKEDINDYRFIPYIQLHEFESIILANLSLLIERFPDFKNGIEQLSQICQTYESPELINDGKTTAPSKRIEQLIPEYKKVATVRSIAKEINLQVVREKCPHFDDWISKLESLGQN